MIPLIIAFNCFEMRFLVGKSVLNPAYAGWQKVFPLDQDTFKQPGISFCINFLQEIKAGLKIFTAAHSGFFPCTKRRQG